MNAGYFFTCASTTTSAVQCWGRDRYGETTVPAIPVQTRFGLPGASIPDLTVTFPDGTGTAPTLAASVRPGQAYTSTTQPVRRLWTVNSTGGTAGWTARVRLYYLDADVPGGADESTFKLAKTSDDGATWHPLAIVDRSSSENWAEADVTGFSTFMLASEVPATAGASAAGISGWRLLAPPVAGASIATLTGLSLVQGIPGEYPAAQTTLYTGYDGAAFTAPASDTDALTPGRGFIWYLYANAFDPPHTDGQSRSTGLPLALSVTGLPLTTSASVVFAAVPADGYHLLGNPFAQSFDIDGLARSSGDGTLSSTVEVWDPDARTYVNLVQDGDVATGDALAVWQGFFALVGGGPTTASTFTYDAAAQRADTPTFYGKTGQAATASEAGPPLYRLDLQLDGVLAGGAATQDRAATLLATGDDADAARYRFDKLDPLTGAYATVAFASRDGVSPARAVEGLAATLAAPVDLPLRVTTTAAGRFALSWPREALPAAWAITLHDADTGTVHDLRATASVAFTMADAGTSTRFTLHIAPGTSVGADGAAVAMVTHLGEVYPNPSRGAAQVTLTLVETSPEVSVSVYDVLGRRVRVLHTGRLAGGAVHRFDIGAAALAPGVYVVRVEGTGVRLSTSFVRLP